MNRIAIAITILTIISPSHVALSFHRNPVSIQSTDNTISIELAVGDEMGGANIAVADLGNDGTDEILVGAGLGSEPRVRVLRQDGSEIGNFLAYAPNMGVGLNVVACDITGDGFKEIITAPQRGGGPHIRVFDRYGEPLYEGFFAYSESFRGGVNLACGDLVGDSGAELVTLPAPGGGPHVRIWSWENKMELQEEFFAFNEKDRAGVIGVVSDKKLFLAQQHTQTPSLKEIVIHSQVTTIDEEELDLDALGLYDIFVHKGEVYVTTTNGVIYNTKTNVSTFQETASGSVSAESNGETIYTVSSRFMFTPSTDPKKIIVDISQQRLYAFEYGVLSNTFLISSGLNGATPLGNHEVLAKIPEVHYAWSYGPGNPNNYDLGWIPYNLRIYPHIYIHYAPWHNNFGHTMSHGCINVALADIMWVYEWAEEGIPVIVQE
ncbi:hypothetical protein CO174_01660 [Candidatus Uhrbacteria bacterium CG_4_9_14_3_um_filter_50_9]|uniref:L,D-TPase catalytic domain-containing protein n=1 Tax=Candidatus Uhrbacteria bacterium CG_4_9_14_3_um_filter_50_9 TaxID=1975035 RepID=A0A2M7XDF0_9BACT|nr:MAG: hypothetical protein CO174_01660 [Candidatus Uhrbacteria bacterium CG_4_9_14_3_um_filter_50_9]